MAERDDNTRQPGTTETPDFRFLDQRIRHVLQESGIGSDLLEAIKRLGGGDGNGGGEKLEPRLAKVESDVGHIQRDLGDLKSEAAKTRDNVASINTTLATLTERMAHLPGKGFIVTAVMGSLAFFGALIVFQNQIQNLLHLH